MNRDRYRSLGAIAGLCLGLASMLAVGLSGMVPGAVFGAGGAVLGGMLGERVHAWQQSRKG